MTGSLERVSATISAGVEFSKDRFVQPVLEGVQPVLDEMATRSKPITEPAMKMANISKEKLESIWSSLCAVQDKVPTIEDVTEAFKEKYGNRIPSQQEIRDFVQVKYKELGIEDRLVVGLQKLDKGMDMIGMPKNEADQEKESLADHANHTYSRLVTTQEKITGNVKGYYEEYSGVIRNSFDKVWSRLVEVYLQVYGMIISSAIFQKAKTVAEPWLAKGQDYVKDVLPKIQEHKYYIASVDFYNKNRESIVGWFEYAKEQAYKPVEYSQEQINKAQTFANAKVEWVKAEASQMREKMDIQLVQASRETLQSYLDTAKGHLLKNKWASDIMKKFGFSA